MASFSLFPRIESDEDRQRREARRVTKPAQSTALVAGKSDLAITTDLNVSTPDHELASVSEAPQDGTPDSSAAKSLQRQPSNPGLSARHRSRSPTARQQKTTRAVSPRLRTTVSSPGLYSPPSPHLVPLLPKEAGNIRHMPSIDAISPAVSSTYSQSPVATSSTTSLKSALKHASVSTPSTTPSSATATSPQFSFSPSIIKGSAQGVVYPKIPTAQSPVISHNSPKKQPHRQSTLGYLPPPPPFPPPAGITRSNTTATYRSGSSLHSLRSGTTQVSAHTSASRSTVKPTRASTTPAPQSIFPTFDPSRPLSDQRRAYHAPYHPARSSRPLTQKALEEIEHSFAAPPRHQLGHQYHASSSTGRTLVGPASTYTGSPEKQRGLQRQPSSKHSMSGISSSTALVVSAPPLAPCPSTSSGSPGGAGKASGPELPDGVQHGVAMALSACTFVIGVGVEVVGGAVGGLKRGVKKEREKQERREEKRAEKARKKEEKKVGAEQVEVRDGAESPGWVVGQGEKRVVDFRI